MGFDFRKRRVETVISRTDWFEIVGLNSQCDTNCCFETVSKGPD